MPEPKKITVLVAGDVCLDVVGIPVAAPSQKADEADNWRLTGEIRTSYLPGGAFQLAEFVRAAKPVINVLGPTPCIPMELACGDEPDKPIEMGEFWKIAE